MSVKKDNDAYDHLHNRLLRDMLLAIKDELDAADLDHDMVHDLTARIAVAVSAILDGGSPAEWKGERMMPFIAFSSEARRDELVVNDHGSYLHELVDSLFESMDDGYEEEDDEEEDEDDYEYEEDEEEEEEEEEKEEEEEEEEDDEESEEPDKRRH